MPWNPNEPVTGWNFPPCPACDDLCDGAPCTCYDAPTGEDDHATIVNLTAERDQLREQLKEERLTSEDEARKRDEHFAENKQLRTALRDTRAALSRGIAVMHHIDDTYEDCIPACQLCRAKSVLVKYAKLAEGSNG